MPNLKWNKNTWDNQYNWDLKGEEWSASWGGSEAQWFSSIYPRIHRFIACDHILEIASGFGRWTKFLKEYALKEYRGVDLSQECIDYCIQQFKDSHIDFIKNDGISLKEVDNTNFDFVFSFDSLVHADIGVLEKYIIQIIDLLSKDGVCFLHHSNFAELIEKHEIAEDHPGYIHNRDKSSSAKKVNELIKQNGGRVLCQEIIDWGGGDSIDCLTTFTKSSSFVNSEEKIIRNSQFMLEASIIHNVHSFYSKF